MKIAAEANTNSTPSDKFLLQFQEHDDTSPNAVASRLTHPLESDLGIPHLVKVGLLGHVGRFESADGRVFSRNDEVICRTRRGLEVGSIMCPVDDFETAEVPESDGQVMRQVTPDDQMILNRIDKFRDRAFAACCRLLDEQNLSAVLVDVEHLFDGQSLYFYFLGEVPDQVHELTGQLAEEYEKKVKFRKFAETLASGCGPDCGTGASKCSTGGCGTCSMSGSCKPSSPTK